VKLRKAIAATVSSPETGSSLSDSPRRGRSGGRSGSPGVIRSNLDSRGGRTAAMSAMPLGRMKAPQKPETLAGLSGAVKGAMINIPVFQKCQKSRGYIIRVFQPHDCGW